MLKLTERQREILQWMTAYIQTNWRPPTVAEIGAQFGITGPSAFGNLRALVKKGYLEPGDGSSRSIRPVDLSASSDVCIDTRLRRAVQASGSIRKVAGFSGSIHVGRGRGRGKPLFTVEVRGDSMVEAMIFDGDLAIVRVQDDVEDGDIVVASVGFEAMIRRIFFHDNGGVLLVAENKLGEPVEAAVGEFVVYGKVIAIHRELE